MLQAGKSQVRDPMKSLNFSNLHNPSSRTSPGVYSSSIRNEYQKQKNNVSGE
jgi:hypothetical protein